jgi:(1->4)-alpha-D-glucan 1-alpha-D-glucosylmutase
MDNRCQRSVMNRVPTSTYRLQLGGPLDFAAVGKLVDYLEQLGISDLYFSPLFRSREDSSHGYDVVSHVDIEPTFGDLQAFKQLSEDVRGRGMGILLDVVPNHMGINDPGNEWWLDVLENGPLSDFADHFDVDWNRPTESLRDKVLLPFLSDYFGSVLERGEFKVVYEEGKLKLSYGERHYPLAPTTWPQVLTIVIDKLTEPPDSTAVMELESIIFELENLRDRGTDRNVTVQEHVREQHVAARRLLQLWKAAPRVQAALNAAIAVINGDPGDRRSFEKLEALLNAQWYRLAYWRVASDEINYRRFFDINDLAAIRVEIPEVFTQVHMLVKNLLCEGHITGLRIDHPDGLYDPQDYFDKLQRLCNDGSAHIDGPDAQLYVVAEKILTGTEELPPQWKVAGTTGYELLNMIGRTLVDEAGLASLIETYDRCIIWHDTPAEVIYESKQQILHEAMSSELTMLSSRLYRIAQQSRMSRDFTFTSLLRALREVIACFPGYRTYVRSQGWDVDAEDHSRIAQAVRLAKVRNPTTARAIYDFISSVLLLEFPPTLEKEQKEQWREFALRFQQVTSPVAAKGVEDTAFYRYFPLLSLNEVGSDLTPTANSVAEFHRLMQRRVMDWPHALSASATHDTKRGEDTRARLHALTEVPSDWRELAVLWEERVRLLVRNLGSQTVPNVAERYFILQTLVGTWPIGGPANDDWKSYKPRIQQYLEKAFREAKISTSWANPAPEYEQAMRDFADDILNPAHSAELIEQIDEFTRLIADAGYQKSLAQLVLKCCVPGVPDFYQGTELWDFSLVDPDNRRPVDFEYRRRLLADLQKQFEADSRSLVYSLSESWPDPRIKMFLTWRLLQLRRRYSELFSDGEYVPLEVQGEGQDDVIAFARSSAGTWIVVVVSCAPQATRQGIPTDLGADDFGRSERNAERTVVLLPDRAGHVFEDVLTGILLWTHELQVHQSLEVDSMAADVLRRDGRLDLKMIADSGHQTAQMLFELRETHPGPHAFLSLSELLRIWPVAVLVSRDDTNEQS